MFALEWWVYPIIAAVVFAAMTLAYRYEERRESRKNPSWARPCLNVVGTGRYCGDIESHTGWCGDRYVLVSLYGESEYGMEENQ